MITAETDTATGMVAFDATGGEIVGGAARRRGGAGSGRTAFYALIDRPAVGRHTFGSVATHRQLTNWPGGTERG